MWLRPAASQKMAQKVSGLVMQTNLSSTVFHRDRRLEAQLCASFTGAGGAARPVLDAEASWWQGTSLLCSPAFGMEHPSVRPPFSSPSSSSGRQLCLLEASSPAVTHGEATLHCTSRDPISTGHSVCCFL